MRSGDAAKLTRAQAIGHAVAASLFAALVASVVVGVPFGAGVVGQFAALAAGVVAGGIALIVSPIMLALARGAGHIVYFYAHLLAGAAGGLLTGVLPPLARYYGYPITLPVAASLAAWLYIVLFHPAKNGWIGAGIAGTVRRTIAVLLGLPVLVAIPFLPPVTPPELIADDSCFNVFRGGKLSARPALMLDVHITDSSDREIHAFYQAFAAEHGLRIKGHEIYGAYSASAHMCNEQVLIQAGGLFPEREPSHRISVFDLDDNDDWRPMAEQLICAVHGRWSDGMRSADSRPEQQPYIDSVIENVCGTPQSAATAARQTDPK